MTDLVSLRLGTVTLEPAGPIVAGTIGEWRITYTVGTYGIDEGGTIKLAQRFASDWQPPQFEHASELGYTTVTTDGQARLGVHYEPKGHERPWMKCVVIDVYDGCLAPGEQVTIVLGDRSAGSTGIRAQTFQESAHEFRILVDPTNACLARPLPTSPTFPIVPDVPAELICTVPSQATVDLPVQVFARGQDRWGNPTPAPEGLSLRWMGNCPGQLRADRLTLTAPGSGVVVASCGELSSQSNRLTAFATEPIFKRYWGDLHAQSDATVGTGNEQEYFTFGRDVAHLDFISHQGNDFQMSNEDWERLNKVVKQFHQDGRFVVLPGYEWSANTPAGGDRNVFYVEEDQPIFRSSHWQVGSVPEDEQTPAHPADVLFQRLRANGNALVGSHVGGRYADIRRYFDQELGPLIELASCWGVFEWMLWDAMEMGYVVGIMCNSDGHKGRPGAEGPGAGQFGIAGGLTCVLAEQLTRSSIFEALKQRRCYGTTGPRIDLAFEINGMPMGSVIQTKERAEVNAVASAKCLAPIESLTLFCGRDPIHAVRPDAFACCATSKRLRVSWRGARIRGRGRRVDWSGSIQMHGPRILSAHTFAFDAPTDGITKVTDRCVCFRSHTTGDVDGIDLTLEQLAVGTICFDSAAARCQVDLAELASAGGRVVLEFGGVGMCVCFERYPEGLSQTEADLAYHIRPPVGQITPYFVKVVQSDGHMAWSSPVYLRATP